MSGSLPALQAGQGVTNPLATVNQALGTVNTANQLSMFPIQKQRAQLALQGDQLGLTDAQNKAAFGYLQSLNGKANVSLQDLWDVAGQAAASGLPTGGLEKWIAQRAATGATNYSGDVSGQIARAAGPVAGTQMQAPTTSWLNTGDRMYQQATPGALQSGAGVAVPTGASMKPGLDPATARQMVVGGYDEQNRPIMVPLGSRPDPGNNANAPASGAPLPNSPLGTGRLPAGLRNPNAAPPASGSTPAAPAGGGSAGPGSFVAPSPQDNAARSTQGAASAQAFTDMRNQSDTARTQVATLGNMLADSQNFTTGQDKLNQFKAFTAKYGNVFGFDPKSVASQESFDKFANMIAGQQGAGSDARLAVAQHANPNSSMLPQTVSQVIHQLQGNADYTIAKQNLASSYKDKGDIDGFQRDMVSKLDPRAFQFARMTPQEKVDYASSLSSKDLASVKSGYAFATKNGLLGQ